MSDRTFVDLFAGAGGLTLGLKRAGFTPIYAQDKWSDAVDTYKANITGHLVECGDIADLTAAHLNQVLPEKPGWIVGGPPCQGYSTVGKRNRDDQRNRLFEHFLRVVKHVGPDGFVIENVLGLKDMSFEREVASAFEECGYRVHFQVASAADHGVPQLRRRVLFIGHKQKEFKGIDAALQADQYVSVKAAIGDLPELQPGETATIYNKPAESDYQRLMRAGSKTLQGHSASKHPPHLIEAIRHISDGGNRTEIPPNLQPKSGFHNSYSRLASWLPAVAVTQNMGKPSGTRCIHPFQHRGLTTREGARLQSFPDTYIFTGPSTSQRLQVANAVPPLLAQALGQALLDPDHWA
ncbi:DNA cytosine methyltransferase [Streptacidiphilus sp. ASG 303]|uniref:DNA cytosine methyltransferase n=1 Tax=Streptacidiphilus sp. ASG 303 TaxID=2896847 RepID=UPI001E58C607|nr:DNA cytosine methyltransferase [Streptacidiphilus sp. ASG 303]MCD0482321.1 DNA cytosine methyltransferase [Streptacidiphilus sp. ASG 303]